MTRALLSEWGLEYQERNVLEDPVAADELAVMGIPGVPATVLDGRFVHGWNPALLAELVGREHDPTPELSPDALLTRIQELLSATEALALPLDAVALAVSHPERPRSLAGLIFHLCRLSAAYLDALEHGGLQRDWLQEEAPADIQDGQALAGYARWVRARFAEWHPHIDKMDFEALVPTYYGPQSAHQLLERTTWHAAQHLRQAHDLADRSPTGEPAPLPETLWRSLPLPESLW